MFRQDENFIYIPGPGPGHLAIPKKDIIICRMTEKLVKIWTKGGLLIVVTPHGAHWFSAPPREAELARAVIDETNAIGINDPEVRCNTFLQALGVKQE